MGDTKRARNLRHVGTYLANVGEVSRTFNALAAVADLAARQNGNEPFADALHSLADSLRRDALALEGS